MPYAPKPVPLVEDVELKTALQYVEDELRALAQELSETTALELRATHVAPEKPREGMLVFADGTDWNPGKGAGTYVYKAGAWAKVGEDVLPDGDMGDITISGSGTVWTIDNDVVTFAKFQNIAAGKLLGRQTSVLGNMQEITLGTNLSLSGTTLNAIGGGKRIGLFRPLQAEYPAANYATLALRNQHPVLQFDDTTAEAVHFTGVVPDHYAGEGFTVELWWAATSAITGTIGWRVDFEKLDGLDIDGDSFGSTTTVTAGTVPGTAGEVTSSTASIADGAAIDSLVASDSFRLRVRNLTTGTAVGDAELVAVEVRIT